MGPNTSGGALAGATVSVSHLPVPVVEDLFTTELKKSRKNLFFSRARVPSQLWYFIDSFV